jgi:hypothetical protein
MVCLFCEPTELSLHTESHFQKMIQQLIFLRLAARNPKLGRNCGHVVSLVQDGMECVHLSWRNATCAPLASESLFDD